jgi:hypothetical protein
LIGSAGGGAFTAALPLLLDPDLEVETEDEEPCLLSAGYATAAFFVCSSSLEETALPLTAVALTGILFGIEMERLLFECFDFTDTLLVKTAAPPTWARTAVPGTALSASSATTSCALEGVGENGDWS